MLYGFINYHLVIMNLNDHQMLQELSAKNQSVFDELYKRHYKRLFILSFKYVKDTSIAEEVVHDVFMKLWNRGGYIKITHSLNSYLSKAIINTSINMLKREKLQTINLTKYENDQICFLEEDEDGEILEKKLLMIESAINQLPTQCKKVLILSKFQKLKQQDIANELKISIKTVKNHLTYAYKKIKENINDTLLLILLLSYLGLF